MVSHKHKYVFIHVPKTGGISIHHLLKTEPAEMNHNGLSVHKFDEDYFKFMFVRNPWDRFVSCYNYFLKNGRNTLEDQKTGKLVQKYKTFQEFSINLPQIINQVKSINPHFNQQIHWLEEGIDFIGRFENIQQDFDTICDKIGIPQQKLPHKNKSKHKHYTEYYDDETKSIVAETYAKDIEHFGYKFEE